MKSTKLVLYIEHVDCEVYEVGVVCRACGL